MGTRPKPQGDRGERRLLTIEFGAYWVTSTIALVGALARAKTYAVHLGPEGVGLLGQLSVLVSLVGALSSVGLGSSGLRLLNESRAAGDAAGFSRRTRLLIIGPALAATLLCLIASAFNAALAGALLNDSSQGNLVTIAVWAAVGNTFLTATQMVLQAARRRREIALTGILTTLIFTVVGIAMTLTLDVPGAVAGLAVTSLSAAAVIGYRYRSWFKRSVTTKSVIPDAYERRVLLSIGTVSLMVLVLQNAGEALLRARLISVEGLTAAGLYQPAYLLGPMAVIPLATAVCVAMVPRMESFDVETVSRVLRHGLRLGASAATPVLLLAIAAAPQYVSVLFSPSFEAAVPAIAIQAAAELFRLFAFIAGAALLPTLQVRAWLLIAALGVGLQLAVGLTLIQKLGLLGLPAANLLQALLVCTLTLAYAHHRWRIIDARTAFVLCCSAGAVAVSTAASLAAVDAGTWVPFVASLLIVATAWRETVASAAGRILSPGRLRRSKKL